MKQNLIPQKLHNLIVAKQDETFRITYFEGKQAVITKRFKPGSDHVLSWAGSYWRSHLRWEIAVDEPLFNTNPPAKVTRADGEER